MNHDQFLGLKSHSITNILFEQVAQATFKQIGSFLACILIEIEHRVRSLGRVKLCVVCLLFNRMGQILTEIREKTGTVPELLKTKNDIQLT